MFDPLYKNRLQRFEADGELQEIAESIEFRGFRWRPIAQLDAEKLAPSLQYLEIADPVQTEDDADDIAWATRSNMWRARAEKASARRTKRAKPAPALILAGHGVSLRIDGGALTIQNGFTHYPQKRETIRFFAATYLARANNPFGRQRQRFL